MAYGAGRSSWASRADARRELGQALPQHPLIVRAVLPCRLEHLMRVESQATVQQILGIGESFSWRQLEIIRDA